MEGGDSDKQKVCQPASERQKIQHSNYKTNSCFLARWLGESISLSTIRLAGNIEFTSYTNAHAHIFHPHTFIFTLTYSLSLSLPYSVFTLMCLRIICLCLYAICSFQRLYFHVQCLLFTSLMSFILVSSAFHRINPT